jgi:hypothetical protein
LSINFYVVFGLGLDNLKCCILYKDNRVRWLAISSRTASVLVFFFKAARKAILNGVDNVWDIGALAAVSCSFHWKEEESLGTIPAQFVAHRMFTFPERDVCMTSSLPFEVRMPCMQSI